MSQIKNIISSQNQVIYLYKILLIHWLDVIIPFNRKKGSFGIILLNLSIRDFLKPEVFQSDSSALFKKNLRILFYKKQEMALKREI